MKIALVYLGRRGSGGPISLALTRALAAQGAQVEVFLSSGLETMPAWAGEAIHTVPTYGSSLGAAWSLLAPFAIRRLAQQIRAARPDVLLFPMFHLWNAPVQRALAPIPAMVIAHDPRPHPGVTGWLHAHFEDASLRQAARVLVLSQELAPELAQRGVPVAHILAIPHGLLEVACQPRTASTAPLVLFFGRITPYKGLEVLLQAYRLLQARRSQVRLLIAGEGSLAPYRRLLDGLSGVELINHWIPEDELPSIFGRAALLVLPYTSASQSGVLALAAACELPVVATRSGGLSRQICDGQTGLLVSPGSVEELAQAIDRLLADPSAARQMGAALRRSLEQEQSWAQAAARLLAAAADLL